MNDTKSMDTPHSSRRLHEEREMQQILKGTSKPSMSAKELALADVRVCSLFKSILEKNSGAS